MALATAQIGEFSFILAAVGERLGVIDDRARNALVAAAIISITVNPLLYRLVGPLESGPPPAPREPGSATASRPDSRHAEEPASQDGPGRRSRYRAVIVGMAPSGGPSPASSATTGSSRSSSS